MNPVVTNVAECRNALTGVGPSIAFGNQLWNRMWVDLTQVPIIKINITSDKSTRLIHR